MGRGDAMKTDKIYLTYPSEWTDRLEAIRQKTGALSLQDVVRFILARYLEGDKTE